MKNIFLSFLLSVFVSSFAHAQSFNATVNRNIVPEGETFVLTLELKDVDT